MTERTRTDEDVLNNLNTLWRVLAQHKDTLSPLGYEWVADVLRETGRDPGDW